MRRRDTILILKTLFSEDAAQTHEDQDADPLTAKPRVEIKNLMHRLFLKSSNGVQS